MKRTILGLLSLVGCIALVGCTQQKVETSESLKDAYFQIAEKLVNKEEISSKYIKKLLNGYNYKKDEEFKIEGQNIDGSDYIQQPYTFTNGNESLNITYSNFNNEEQIHPLYNLKDEKGETNLSILLPEIDDTKMRYMYIANRDNLKDHKKLLEKLDNNEGKWRDVYIKVIDNVCSTNDMDIEEIKNLLGIEYNIDEYPYDEKSSLGLNVVEYIFETDDEMFMVQYIKEKDKIFNVFYNDKNTDTINILVNNKKVKASYNLKLDDNIYINDDYTEEVEIKPENIPLDIVYEDDYLLVVNKKSGMVVHPAVGNYSGTLVNALMYHINKLSSVNGSIRPGIVHRIDADTSGLLLVAKNDKAHNILAEAIAKKEVVREYIALVEGIIMEDTATIDAPIGRDKKDRKKMTVTSENSKDAVTHIRVLERYKDSTLIRCKLETGRTHQIRVHLSYIGHPVVNDPVYGHKKLIDKDFGQMLHAEKLGFVHPTTKEYMEFTAEPPKRFQEILNIYKEK